MDDQDPSNVTDRLANTKIFLPEPLETTSPSMRNWLAVMLIIVSACGSKSLKLPLGADMAVHADDMAVHADDMAVHADDMAMGDDMELAPPTPPTSAPPVPSTPPVPGPVGDAGPSGAGAGGNGGDGGGPGEDGGTAAAPDMDMCQPWTSTQYLAGVGPYLTAVLPTTGCIPKQQIMGWSYCDGSCSDGRAGCPITYAYGTSMLAADGTVKLPVAITIDLIVSNTLVVCEYVASDSAASVSTQFKFDNPQNADNVEVGQVTLMTSFDLRTTSPSLNCQIYGSLLQLTQGWSKTVLEQDIRHDIATRLPFYRDPCQP
jgi:hypothetical protein